MNKDKDDEQSLIDRNTLNVNASGRPTNGYQFKQNENAAEEQDKIVQLTPYRYVIVIIYCLLNFINGMHWITFASCAAKFGKFYHLSTFEVDLLSLIFMILYVFFSIPEAYLMDNISMRVGLNISAILLIAGSFLKVFINTSISWAYIGQVLTALFQPAILNSPAKIAATWFDEKSRVIVTSICCSSNTIGVMIGYLIHTFVMEENIVNPKMFKNGFESYLLIEAFITLFCGIIFMVSMKNKPKHPPSISQEVKSLPLLKGLKKLKSDKNFILLCISLACVVGYINIVATIFNAYMAMYKISDSNASYISAIANILGIINAIVVGAIIDKYKKYKLLIIICNIISLSCYVVTTILIEIIKTKYLYLIAGFGYTLIIMFAVPIYTSGMDFVCEITFGVGESTSEGIIMISNQAVGILGIYITDLLRSNLKRYKYLTNIFGILLFLVSLIVLYFVNPVLVRNEKDHVNNEFEIKEIDYA